MAKSEKKDEFNFDDFQYSGVKLTPTPDFSQAEPVEDPLAPPSATVTPDADASDVAAPLAEEIAPIEPEDKKEKKKAKKVKPVKVKKTAAPADVAEGEKQKSEFLKQLSEASPYTVLLGMTVVVLLLSVIFLFVEWSRYDRDTSAAKAKQLTSINKPFVQSGGSYWV